MAATAAAVAEAAVTVAKQAIVGSPAPRATTLFPPDRFRFVKGRSYNRILAKLPQEYQKFYEEWHATPTRPIHWIPVKEKWTRNPKTGEVKVVQNCPIPVMFPHQSHRGIWGGEGVIEGTVKKSKFRRPVPWFWVPDLKKSVVYSEILNKHLSVVVTDTTHQRIDECEGFDGYLLKSPACDLQSTLALKIKRRILYALLTKDFCHDDAEKKELLLEKYKNYLIPASELEWYGLTIDEAVHKLNQIKKQIADNTKVPLKLQYRKELIEELKAKKLSSEEQNPEAQETGMSAMMSRLNPFSKPSGVPDEKNVVK